MKTAVMVLYPLTLGLFGFGWWGRFTQAGRLRYDEMAGMVPLFSYWLGLVLGGVATVLLVTLLLRGGPSGLD